MFLLIVKTFLRSTYESIGESNIIDSTILLPGIFNKGQTIRDTCQRIINKPMVGFIEDNYQKIYQDQISKLKQNHLFTDHKNVNHLIWSMRKFGNSAFLSPVIATFLIDQIKSGNDLITMVNIFRIFSSVFDPNYIESDTILNYPKELKNFQQCLEKLNQEIRLNSDLTMMFRSNKIDDFDVNTKSITLQRLLYIAKALSIFHNWHKEKSQASESDQEMSKNNCKSIASLVMPTFIRLLNLISKFS